MKMKLDQKTLTIWNQARACNCLTIECDNNHRLCAICLKIILYGSHESNQPTSRYAWNVDHIRPLSRGGTNHISNLQAVHIVCNRYKGSSTRT